MVVVLETWTLVVGRDPDWAEVLVTDGDVNLGKERQTKTVKEDTTFIMGWLNLDYPAQQVRLQSLRWTYKIEFATSTARVVSITG